MVTFCLRLILCPDSSSPIYCGSFFCKERLGQEELDLKLELPVRAIPGRAYVIIGRQSQVDREFAAELHDFPDPAADRHGPHVPVWGVPVGRDDGRGAQVPTVGQVGSDP